MRQRRRRGRQQLQSVEPPALGADAGTQHYEGLVRTGGAFYRVTVRVEGPRNTVAYAQAILQ